MLASFMYYSMFEAPNVEVDVNRLCVPVMVWHEDDRENPMTVKQDCKRLQELSHAPISCLVGTMESLSEEISHLPLLQRHSSPVQSSHENTVGHLESTANEKREKPRSILCSNSCKSHTVTEKMMDIPKMVELYQCPQFGDVPVPLPHNTAYSAIVTSVIQAQRHLVHKPRLKTVFHNILSSPTVESFVINSFWWLFLENFQPDRKAQDRLFGRIAENYISILTQSLSSNSGTIFLQDLPSILSQVLFCCFSCCFPQSCCFCDPTFLTALCSTVYQWTGGLCPAPEVYKQWDFEALEANESSNILLREKKKKENDSSLTSIDSVFSSIFLTETSSSHTAVKKKRMKSLCDVSQADALNSKNKITMTCRNTSKVEKTAASQNNPGCDLKGDHRNTTSDQESHAVDGHMEVKHCVFNVWGNSPLVQHYMNTMHLQSNIGYNVLVRRTQIQALHQANSPTYRDVLRQTRQRSSCQWKELRSLWAQHSREISIMQKKREDEQNQLLRKHKKILSQRPVVHKLCQLLVPPNKGEEESKTRSERLLAFRTIIAGIE
ncbi:protein FAM227A-like isoform X2 [Tachysurus fulvidraco]|uniref:protein FAM227A-like isoform X2 n=1 Tax=Tachysurus fulvidraco TaxID=1234273 RepID=UPI001FF0624C|nr:protein FAM227A-like isoform X2 [Tachysurus fulvidraco]